LLNNWHVGRAIQQKKYRFYLHSWTKVSLYQYSRLAQHLEVRQVVHVKVTVQKYQDAHAKQQVYSAPLFVSEEAV
jgi:hypothetical protein